MNQVAFITGGSRGIGKAVAIGLLEHGFECALVARESARLEETVTELKKLYPRRSILSFAIDVTDKEAITTAIHETTKTYNRIDVAFNNAGIFALGSLNIENDSLQQMMDINYFGAVNVARPILKQFEKQKSGYLINLASVCGKIGFAGFSGYCASKFAL